MLTHDKDLLLESKQDISSFKNHPLAKRRVYFPPMMVVLEVYSIDSGGSYVQPENSSGIWGTLS